MEVDLVVVTGLAGIGTTLGAWAMIWTYRQGKRLQELQGRLAAHNVAQIDRAELLIRWAVERAAARLATGTWFNGGQTCIAPDYVLSASGWDRGCSCR